MVDLCLKKSRRWFFCVDEEPSLLFSSESCLTLHILFFIFLHILSFVLTNLPYYLISLSSYLSFPTIK